MKTNIHNMFSKTRSYSDVGFDCRLTVGSLSVLYRSAMQKMMMALLLAFTVGIGQMWGADVTGTIYFGSASGSTNINGASVSGDDDQSNEWTITTEGTTSFTPQSGYAQVGSGNKPATSITFTTTLASSQTIKAFSAKFGGFNNTAGTVTLKVGETTVGTGSLNGTSDVTISNSSNGTGTVLTVTVTNINKGVKCYYISYTYASGPTLYTVTFDANGGSVTPSSATQASADAAVSLPTPTKSGYTCTGWYTATSGGTKRGDAGGSYTPTSSETIHAQWSAKTYSNYRTLCKNDNPTVSVTSSLTDLGYVLGNSPVAQTFSITGSNLTNGTLTITAPEHFQVSLDGSAWSASDGTGTKTISVASATLSSTTIHVRLASGKSAGEYSGNVEISGCGLASAVTVALTGTVVAPTITASPTSVTWNTQIGVAAETRSVTVTGTNLKASIYAELTDGDATSFSISPASITQTSGSASGSITITYTGPTAAETTKSTKLLLTSTDADPVEVAISFSVISDPREKFDLLTNASNLTAGAKIILVYEYESSGTHYRAMKNYTGTKGSDAVEEGNTEFEVSGTSIYLEESNNVQVLDVGESGDYFSLYTGSAYLQNSADKTLSTTTTTPLPDAAKWAVSVDGTYYTAAITSQGTQGQDIRYNSGQAITAQPFRCYASSAQQDIYIYYQPSSSPSISVSPTSLTGLGYVVGDGANSTIKDITVSGMNLTGNLTVKAPTNYQVSTDGGTNWSSAGGTASITASGTLSSATVKVRLVSGKTKGTYNDATGVKVYGGGVLEANAKTISLEGAVTNPFHTVAISAGSNGSVSPSGNQSVEEGGTLSVTATPNNGYNFDSWTVTGTGASCTSSASGTFTMGTTDATLTANFAEKYVTSIVVSGTTTIKPENTTQLTATCTPSDALNTDITWSSSNTGVATVSSTGLVTGVAAGNVTITATNTRSGKTGTITVTVQNVVLYKYKRMTVDDNPFSGDYLIVNEYSSTTKANVLKGSDPGESNYLTDVTISKVGNDYFITLEDSDNDAFTITNGKIKGKGSAKYIYATSTGSFSANTTEQSPSQFGIASIEYGNTPLHLRFNASKFRFYSSSTQGNEIRLYKREQDFTITCNTPVNGTLSSSANSAAAGTTITLTATPSSGYELESLKYNDGSNHSIDISSGTYSFTMPSANVTVTATFKTAVSHTLHFNVPTCVTPPSDLTGKATGATVTMPSAPSETPEGYTFLGWTMSTCDGVSVQPTTVAAGSTTYKVPSGDVTLQYYALYSEGSISVGSGTFNYTKEASSGLTNLVQLTSDAQYILSSSGNKDNILSNTISGNRVGYSSCTGAGTSAATITTTEGVYLLHKTGSYYTLQSVASGQYLASNGNASQATMMDDDGTDDHVLWSIVSTSAGYNKLANKYNTDHGVNAYLGYSSGNGYGCYAASNGTTGIYFYKAASGAVTNNTTYTTSPDCFCDYRLMASTNSGSTWTEVGCFTKVKPNDASDHEWQLSNFTMPPHNNSNLLKVQKDGADVSQTALWQSGWIPLAELQGSGADHQAFDLAGAVGTLRIYDDNNTADQNFYLGFLPTYQITYGVDGGSDPWTNVQFEYKETTNGHVVYETAMTTAPSGYFSNSNFKFYVGAMKSLDGTTKFADKNSNSAHKKSVTQSMNTMGGMNSNVEGRSGVYQIWANYYDNSADGDNWYCQFTPYYVVYYYDVNGNEIEDWRDVMTSTSTTVHSYATGQTSWNTVADGSGTPYAAGAAINNLSGDLKLYQIASTYTVTYSVASETSSYNGTSVKVIQGQSVTLPMITFSCGLYDTFVGWVSGSAIAEQDPAAKIDEPSSLVGAGGDSYTPTGNVTLRALYGYDCSGNAGWQKQTSISGGKYIIVAGTYGFSGLESAVYSTTNQGSYLSNVSVSDNTVTSSTGMHEVNVFMGTNGTFAIQYSSGQYMENRNGYFNGNITSLSNAYRWKMNASGQIYDASATTYFLQINNSNHKFKCYTGTQSTYANLYKLIKQGYYTTNPTCDTPEDLTVTFNANSPTGDNSDVQNLPTTIVRSFGTFPDLSTAIDLSACSTPTLDGYTIQKWNTAANGSGEDYALDATISSYSGSALTLYAIWSASVSFNLGNATGGTGVPDALEADGGFVLPTPTAAQLGTIPCEYEFYGWSESSVSATTTKPTLYMPGVKYTGSYRKLYAVYRLAGEASADPNLFSLSYTYNSTKYYVSYPISSTADNATQLLGSTNSANAAAFGVESVDFQTFKALYYMNEGVKEYLYWYTGDGTSIRHASTKPTDKGWNIIDGTGTKRLVPSNATDRNIAFNDDSSDPRFRPYQNNTDVLTVEEVTATSYTYATNPNCSTTATLVFDANGGTLNYPEGYSSATDYEDLTIGTSVYLPTATFAGEWKFEGWIKGSGLPSQATSPAENPNFYPVTLNTTTYSASTAGETTFYAIYSKTVNDKQWDPSVEGTYKIFAIMSDGTTRRFMPAWGGTQTTLSYTTACTEAGDYTITPGTEEHAGQYKITHSTYTLGVVSDSDTKLKNVSNAWWNIEPSTSGKGTYRFTIVGSGDRCLCYSGFETFGNYTLDQVNSPSQPNYRDLEIGECIYTEYTSTPANVPYITIKGDPVKVTSTNGKRIKSSTQLHIEAHNFGGVRTINLSATNGFATNPTSVSTSSNGSYSGDVEIYYQPSTNGDGSIVTSVLTATESTESVTQTFSAIKGRNMPANFVIAAKMDGKWYALPADCTTSDVWTGVLIDVDDADDPTEATAALNTKFGLREVASGQYAANGSHVTFTERLSTATANDQKTLYNGADTKIQVNAMWKGYAVTIPEKYEWIPSTTDLKDYTLTSADGSNSRPLCLSTSGTFGTYTSGQAYDGKVRLLPATFYDAAPMQVLEWKANSVVVMYTGTETSATTQVGDNTVSSAQTLATQKLTHGVYELATDQALTSNDGKSLTVNFGLTKAIVDIPVIITGNANASDGHSTQDVVIVKGGKLTAQSTKYSYNNVYVYGGGKLDVSSGTSLGVNNIILRAGGITTNCSGGSAAYDYVYPQVKLGGTLTSTKTDIKYEYITDYDHWYHLCLPFNALTGTITYPTEYYGNNVTANNTGSWIIKRYAGEIRATGNNNAWVDIESTGEPTPTTVTAGHGYIFWGAPKKVTIGGDKQRQQWGIQRITMPITSAANATTAETTDKTIGGLSSYKDVEGKSSAVNDQGWNLIGNPYMANLTGLNSESLKTGKLVEDGQNPGHWVDNQDDIRYVTIPSDHFDTYEAQTMGAFTAENPMVAGRTFFVQIDGDATGVTFLTAKRAALAPAWQRSAEADQVVDVETGIVMSGAEWNDEVDFWIKDGKTEEYEFNADYPKTPNTTNFNIYGVHPSGNLSWVALGPPLAEREMAIGYQVPQAGDYILSLSEKFNVGDLESVLVTDHGVTPELTTDLMINSYLFTVQQAETNNERFTVSIKVREREQITTGVDDAAADTGAQKFIYHDKMYILNHGIIYDATGKRVNRINK